MKLTIEYTFKIPSLPKSSNAIYQIIYSQRRVILSPDARSWKTMAKQFMPPMRFEESDKLYISILLRGNFYYKNGKPKRVDLHNLIKLVQDAVCEHCRKDDSLVWEAKIRKQDHTKDEVIVHIRPL